MRNAGSVADVDMGSDHRAIEMVMECKTNNRRNQHGKPLDAVRTRRVPWNHVCTERYASQVSNILNRSPAPTDTEKRCEFIEATLLEACKLSEKLEERTNRSGDADELLRELMERRRSIKTAHLKIKCIEANSKTHTETSTADAASKSGENIEGIPES